MTRTGVWARELDHDNRLRRSPRGDDVAIDAREATVTLKCRSTQGISRQAARAPRGATGNSRCSGIRARIEGIHDLHRAQATEGLPASALDGKVMRDESCEEKGLGRV